MYGLGLGLRRGLGLGEEMYMGWRVRVRRRNMYGLGFDSLRFLLTHDFHTYFSANSNFQVILTQNL